MKRTIGETVRNRRRTLGLTQEELAELAGVAVRTVHEIEHDKPTLRLDSLSPVLETLGLELTLALRQPAGANDQPGEQP